LCDGIKVSGLSHQRDKKLGNKLSARAATTAMSPHRQRLPARFAGWTLRHDSYVMIKGG
jgi:hypothetical protein